MGRATVLEFAKRGASLVLASRNESGIESLSRECRELGTKVLLVTLDVTNAEAVDQLANLAVKRFGHIDVWVNNAAVGVRGAFFDVPQREHRRVIETNLLGYLHGSWSALGVFRKQRRGTLINNASMGSLATLPRSAAYFASTHALRGMALSMRQELQIDGHDNIHVCLVHPAAVDTLAYQRSATIPGHAGVTLESVAQAIVGLARNPEPEIQIAKSAVPSTERSDGGGLSLVVAAAGALVGYLAVPRSAKAA